ncbi:hypothetical protein BB559_002725 [Furculomyces boomerangus]|uniref:Uncharacterized protein n=2 Tax=Harpellales TaxID=61421 RepID=A0A2T9YSW2_9FUNG|nr:hypothetical protein BB559_002725 [Furculomyces boomerangus]PWA02724.1 hypothetical protein BB558_001137 [Smittium angustum]
MKYLNIESENIETNEERQAEIFEELAEKEFIDLNNTEFDHPISNTRTFIYTFGLRKSTKTSN